MLRGKATKLRSKGNSIGYIEKTLGIPRSTLSGWLRSIELTQKQKNNLNKRWRNGLFKARKKASQWHRDQKILRLKKAESEARTSLRLLNAQKKGIIELALAMLYLGEGFKKGDQLAMGNSNPTIMQFFLSALERIYELDRKNFHYELHLRADQNPSKFIRFWSDKLETPAERFTKPLIDKRTLGRPTYSDYFGVCVAQCGNVAIQRKIIYLSNLFCDKIIKNRRV